MPGAHRSDEHASRVPTPTAGGLLAGAGAAGVEFAFRATWRNTGVVPCYPGGHPALTLKEPGGGLAAVIIDESFDVRRPPVGAPDAAGTRLQEMSARPPFTVKVGTYEVYISVGTAAGTPTIALPVPGGEGTRRHRVGVVEIAPGSGADG